MEDKKTYDLKTKILNTIFKFQPTTIETLSKHITLDNIFLLKIIQELIDEGYVDINGQTKDGLKTFSINWEADYDARYWQR